MIKSAALFCTLALLSFNALAADATKTTTAPAAATTPATTVNPESQVPAAAPNPFGLPLNKYGAINVNAKIPIAVQVPAVPADFKAPDLNPLADFWTGVVPAAPTLNVTSYLLMDANTGAVLAEYNGNKRIAPASITKLMLVYLVEQQLASGTMHLTDTVRVARVAWATGGSRMFLKPGDTVTIQQLIDGALVDSGNDAAVALAMALAGSQDAAVGMMNQEAQQLGMTNTHFNDVMGLPAPNHYSSARDLAVLSHAIVTQYPQYLAWFGQKAYSYNNIKQYNFNKLLFIYPYADGLKTGSTQEAGYSLASTAKMPNDPMRLIAVVIGAPTNTQNAENSKALLMYGFRFFQSQLIYPAGQVLNNVNVTGGAQKTVPVGITQPVYAAYPRGLKDALMPQLQIDKNLTAPIQKGQVLGQVVITLKGKTIATVPAVAMSDVPRGSLWQRLMEKL